MKNVIFLCLIVMFLGAGLWIGYKNGVLKKPVDQFLQKGKGSEDAVNIEPDKAETVTKVSPKKTEPKQIEPTKEIKSQPPTKEPASVKTTVLPAHTTEAQTILKSAQELADQGEYQKARELLKKTRDLKIAPELLKNSEELYTKYRDFDRLTRFIDPLPRKENGGIDIIEYANGNKSEGIVLSKNDSQIQFQQLQNGIKGTVPTEQIEKIQTLSKAQAHEYFLKQFEKLKTKVGDDPQKFYELLEYACERNLQKEIHSFLEQAHNKNQHFHLPATEAVAKKQYRQYVWAKMKGDSEKAEKYLKRVLSAFNDTETASLAREDEEEEKNPQQKQQKLKALVQETKSKEIDIKPIASSGNTSPTQQADQHHQKGMEFVKKAQPGMPESDQNLAKAKAEFEKAVRLYDVALEQAERKGEKTGAIESKMEATTEMLYFCNKQTRLGK